MITLVSSLLGLGPTLMHRTVSVGPTRPSLRPNLGVFGFLGVPGSTGGPQFDFVLFIFFSI